ncbi:hypothetical protein KY290_001627 [Solanum tuberosum]|uniref:Uncharacterized protein n=1 Tax=Solanum tuberosum TaxID=4113 RepID=A0ABQ7WMW5_SOLTU|nr:hypothetical protein KY284_001663 [Solanum tuberosum]KAH0782029.1 hypothetical protein KY290_001627 [Solanum tuberosum]
MQDELQSVRNLGEKSDATGSEVGKTIHGTIAEVQILGNQVLKKAAGNKKILEDNIQGNEVVTWGQRSPEIMKDEDGALSSKEIASSSARQMHGNRDVIQFRNRQI